MVSQSVVICYSVGLLMAALQCVLSSDNRLVLPYVFPPRDAIHQSIFPNPPTRATVNTFFSNNAQSNSFFCSQSVSLFPIISFTSHTHISKGVTFFLSFIIFRDVANHPVYHYFSTTFLNNSVQIIETGSEVAYPRYPSPTWTPTFLSRTFPCKLLKSMLCLFAFFITRPRYWSFLVLAHFHKTNV